jgi:hypothetical protein
MQPTGFAYFSAINTLGSAKRLPLGVIRILSTGIKQRFANTNKHIAQPDSHNRGKNPIFM